MMKKKIERFVLRVKMAELFVEILMFQLQILHHKDTKKKKIILCVFVVDKTFKPQAWRLSSLGGVIAFALRANRWASSSTAESSPSVPNPFDLA
jgi:hypothetical protein